MAKLPFKPRMPAVDRRRLIEGSAQELFAERGYGATSLDDIASTAGITKAVIYDHFKSKAQLHAHLLERQTDELLAFVAARTGALDVDPATRMARGLDAFFEFVETHPYAWRMIFRDPPADGQLASVHRRIQARASRDIAERLSGQAGRRPAAQLPQRVELLAEGLKWATNGLAAWWYEHPEVGRPEIVAAAMDLTWVGLERVAARDRPETR